MNCFQRNDAMLMEILQEHKTVVGFLDAVFGFLRRNTDFYHTKTDCNDKIGFEKGVREKLIYGCMERYDPDCVLPTMTTTDCSDIDGECAPPAIMEITVDDTAKIPTTKCNSTSSQKLPVFLPNDYKNGSVFEHYCWSQSLNEIELHVLLPPALRNAKQLRVQMTTNSIIVGGKCEPMQILVAGELVGQIKHNDAVWTLDKGMLLISCDKAKEQWWDRLFVSETPVDVKKLDCERYIDELPEESQAQIEKLRVQQMTIDQQTKLESKSTFKNDETLDRLRLAWDADGSPFKGQPFDPSVVKFS